MSEQNIPYQDPRNIAELTADIHAGVNLIERAISSLIPEEMTEIGPQGEWSVKDHIAHLTNWRRIILAELQGRPTWDAVGLTREAAMSVDMDGLNELMHKKSLDLPLEKVLADYRDLTAKILAQIAPMSEEDLGRPYHPDDPNSQSTIQDGIMSNTYGHDLEHLEWIGEMLRARSDRKRAL